MRIVVATLTTCVLAATSACGGDISRIDPDARGSTSGGGVVPPWAPAAPAKPVSLALSLLSSWAVLDDGSVRCWGVTRIGGSAVSDDAPR